MVSSAKALGIAIDEKCTLSFIYFDTSTTWTICLPTLTEIFMLVQLILDKLVEDIGVVGAITIPAHDDHFSNILANVDLRHQTDLNILKDTVFVKAYGWN